MDRSFETTDRLSAPDRIHLTDHRRTVEIGAFAEERGRAQELRFDLWAELEPREPADADLGDDVDRVLSYDRLIEAIDAALGAGRVALLETLAERIAALLLSESRISRVGVRIGKLGRVLGALGIEIQRRKASGSAGAALADARPKVVFLSAAAARSERLGLWLDGLAHEGAILAPDFVRGPTAGPRMEAGEAGGFGSAGWSTGDAEADARIALLALGQAAWALRARDPRLAVVESRTEILAASRDARLVVWAPEKLVSQAGPGDPPPNDPVALAGWLSRTLHARGFLTVGVAASEVGRSLPLDAEVLE